MYLTQCKTTLTLYHELPKVKTLLITQGGRGGGGGYRGRGGRSRGRGDLILCYWCRDFLPKEQANHKVSQCPYQSQAMNDW